MSFLESPEEHIEKGRCQRHPLSLRLHMLMNFYLDRNTSHGKFRALTGEMSPPRLCLLRCVV